MPPGNRHPLVGLETKTVNQQGALLFSVCPSRLPTCFYTRVLRRQRRRGRVALGGSQSQKARKSEEVQLHVDPKQVETR
jgi:hypothetical protein